jgi:hypothetical protein
VLSYAAKRNLITAVPEFPSVRLVDKARGWFTWHEYRRLWSKAGSLCGKTIEVRKHLDAEGITQTQYIHADASNGKVGKLMRNVVMTEDLRRLIVFMVNSYIRPTDIKFMQHKHVDVMRGKNVFVTGADGFIGSHLTELLVNLGASVRAMVYYNSWNEREILLNFRNKLAHELNP